MTGATVVGGAAVGGADVGAAEVGASAASDGAALVAAPSPDSSSLEPPHAPTITTIAITTAAYRVRLYGHDTAPRVWARAAIGAGQAIRRPQRR